MRIQDFEEAKELMHIRGTAFQAKHDLAKLQRNEGDNKDPFHGRLGSGSDSFDTIWIPLTDGVFCAVRKALDDQVDQCDLRLLELEW